jgi:BMFP domain-containing protein YqiC
LEQAMQTDKRIFDDLAKVASGALHAFGGVKDEIETRFRERLERLAADMQLVTREELDAVRGMAAKARATQETLEARIAALEAQLAASSAPKPARSRRPKKEPRPSSDEESGLP